MARLGSFAGVAVVVGAALGIAPPAIAQEARRADREAPTPPPTLTKPPRLLQAVAPVYPPAAAAAGRQAEVRLRLTIDEGGAITRAEVVTPVGEGFDEAAIAAAERYVFEPAEWDGVPGPITVETTIRFVQEVEEAAAPAAVAPGAHGAASEGPPAPPGHAGDATAPIAIEGRVLERGVRRELAGVIVSLAELGLDAITDEEGRFWFHGVAPGRYTVVAVDPDFDRLRRPIDVAAGEVVEVALYLRPRGGNPYETVVEGERETIEVTRRTIERRQMTTVPGTFGDPIRVIQTLPGLARTPFSIGLLIIRGSNPDDTGVFVDGHRVPLLFHFLGGPSILNAEFLERIDLYPGGFPARFGRGHGGVVALESRSAKSDGVHGSADVDLLDSGAYVRAPVGEHGALAIAGRRSYLDLMLGFFLPEPEPGETLIVVPVYYDYQLRYDHDLGRHGSATVFVLGSSDELDVLSADAEDEEFFDLGTRIRFLRVIGTYRRPLAGRLELTLSPAWGRDSVSISSAPTEGAAAFTSAGITEDTLSYRARVAGPLGSRVYLDAGLDLESRVTTYDLLVPVDVGSRTDRGADLPPERLERATDVFGFAAHADVAVDLGPLRLVPGLRADGYLIAGEWRGSLDPRLVARWAVTPRWTAKAYGGLYHQPPQPEALDHTFGNPDVELEWAVHAGVGGEWRPTERWLVDGEVYAIERRHQVESVDTVERDPATGALTPLNYDNTRRGQTHGFELLVKREVSRSVYGWLSYTLGRTEDDPGDERSPRPSGFDQRHTANAVASYRFASGWELGGRFRLSTGRPLTAVAGHTFDADEGDYDRVNGEFRAERAPLFQQADVRLEKTWTFDTWMIGCYLDVQNLFNVENQEALQYDYRYVERSPVTGIPFLPTIGVRGQW